MYLTMEFIFKIQQTISNGGGEANSECVCRASVKPCAIHNNSVLSCYL